MWQWDWSTNKQAIQFLKAAYGLTVAPKEFYRVLKDLGLKRLKSDPSIWILTKATTSGTSTTIGAVGAHVDDFLLVGDERDPQWVSFLEAFHERTASMESLGMRSSPSLWSQHGAEHSWTLAPHPRSFLPGNQPTD